MKLFIFVFGLLLSSMGFAAQGNQLQRPCMKPTTKNRKVSSVPQFPKSVSCQKLLPGKSRVVEGQIADRTYYYELNRLVDDLKTKAEQYEIVLPITFFKLENHEPSQINFAEIMRSNAQKCYDSVKPRMLGPKGERLSIRLDVKPTDYKGPVFQVWVYQGQLWTPFMAWNIDYDCATLFHETLHALGLADEYPEEKRGFFKDAEDQFTGWATKADEVNPALKDKIFHTDLCPRPIAPEDSIMNNQFKAFSSLKFRKSIFFANQFKALTESSECNAEVKMFHACTSNSNLTKADGCLPTPKECSGTSMKWLDDSL